MHKSEIYALLGVKLGACIDRFHFPSLDMDIFSSGDFRKLRNQLYNASANNQTLGQQMIRILLKGRVEEIKTIDETLIFSVQFEYKGEQYIAELKLENYRWSFMSIHYAGKAPQAKKVSIWAGTAVVVLSVLLFSAFFIMQYIKEKEETIANQTEMIPTNSNDNSLHDSALDQEESIPQEDSIPLTELEQMAKKMDLVLIDEQEYQKLIQEKSQIGQQASDANVDSGQAENEDGALESNREDSQTIVITVKYKMTAEQVAKLLVESQLEAAQDVEDLTKFFVEQNMQYKIRTGTYEIPLDATYMDIVRILTTRK